MVWTTAQQMNGRHIFLITQKQVTNSTIENKSSKKSFQDFFLLVLLKILIHGSLKTGSVSARMSSPNTSLRTSIFDVKLEFSVRDLYPNNTPLF